MKKLRKPVSILLSFVLILSLFTIVPFSVSAEEISVSYVDKTWTPNTDSPGGALSSSEETVQNAISLTDEITEWGGGNYYALDSNVTFYKTITVTGNAYLILCNGCTLKSSYGVYVKDGAHLTIYGQDGDTGCMEVSNAKGAAIGGWDDKIGGTVTIKGGSFDLRGGSKDAAIGGGRAPSGFNAIEIYGGNIDAEGGHGAAAIGGGRKNDNAKCGPIKIYGGNINPTAGTYGAGIGGGNGMDGGAIEINGGNIIIQGVLNNSDVGKYGAGIGGGESGDGGTITINGGNIIAYGGNMASGIGGGEGGDSGNITINGGDITAMGSEFSAGIGGGNNGDGENITINGGTIQARGGRSGAGIGGGDDGDNGNITINGGFIKAVGGTQGAGIGTGYDNFVDSKIIINDGTVLAVSDKGAAIGGGDDADLERSIYINGGSVYAASGIHVTNFSYEDFDWVTVENFANLRSDEEDSYCGAAIGAGAFANQDATIYITGGDVHAFGGKSGGAGIGAGSEQDMEFNDGGEGGDVVITGGTVEVKSGDDASAIGHGWHGSDDGDLTLPADYSVYDYGTEAYTKASKRVEQCHKRESHILIAPCEHPNGQRYFTLNDSTKETEHTRLCKICNYSAVESHYGDPCACDFANGIVYVTLVNTDESHDIYPVPYGSEFVFPEGKDYVTDDFVRLFRYWKSSNWDWYDPGDSVTVTDNTTFTVVPKTEYYVKTAEGIEHGSVKTDRAHATDGEFVTVSVEPEKGYTVDAVTVAFEDLTNHAIDHETVEANEDGEYQFMMRYATATVSATFNRMTHEHDGISFEPCTSGVIASGSGSWLLMEDTELSIASLNANETLNICLNGYKLTVTDDNFTVAQDATLRIFDDDEAGIVTGNTINVYGNFILYGGRLTGFTTGAVKNFGHFDMFGGSIVGNTSATHGAGVYSDTTFGAFRIKGDVIIRNNSYTGDGEDVDENVYLANNENIYVYDKLGENAQIGITAERPNTAATVVDNLSGNGTLSNFFSDKEDCYLLAKGSGAVLSPYKDGMGATVIGHSITLDGDIAVNYYMELSQDIINSSEAYVQFSVPGTSTEYRDQRVYVKAKAGEQRNTALEVKSDGKTYYLFKCRVPAKDMRTRIEAQMINGENQGTVCPYSVMEYAEYLLAHRTEYPEWEAAVPLVKAMMAYGDQANAFFDASNTGDAELIQFGHQIPEGEYANTLTQDGAPVFVGATLSLKSRTTLSLYFKSEQELTLTCEGREVETKSNGNDHVIRIRGIAIKELDQPITVGVSYGGNSGTVTYSPLRYCYLTANNDDSSNKLRNTVNALYDYYLAAKAYFTNDAPQPESGE